MTTDEAVTQVSQYIGKNFVADLVPTTDYVSSAISNICDRNGIRWAWLQPGETLGDSDPSRVVVHVDENNNVTSVTSG